MRSKGANYTLLVVLVLLIIFVLLRRQEPERKEAFDRDPDHISYTKHALCRMDCRKISREDIQEIMERGVINLNHSNRRDRPCPTFAVQGETSDGIKIPPAITVVPHEQVRQMDDDAMAIMSKKAVMVPGEEGLKDIRVVEAIYRSVKEKGRVKI